MTETLLDIGILKSVLLVKTIMQIIFVILPLIMMYQVFKSAFEHIIDPNKGRAIKDIAMKLIAAFIVFLVPSTITYTISLADPNASTKVSQYFEKASNEEIKRLEEEYKKQVEADKAKNTAEVKEGLLKKYEEEKRKNEMMEEQRKEHQEQAQSNDTQNTETNNTPAPGYTDTAANGTFGSVKYENGTFIIPNKRASSDSDIPKQSGEYGLNPIFWERLNKLISDAKAAGYSVKVTSGWRSYSSQLSLWTNSKRACSVRNQWVACPGGSRHGFGIAADLSYDGSSCNQSNWDCTSAAKWVHNNASKYGLTFRLSNEPWHIEPDKVTGGSFGSCQQKC